MVGTVWKQLGDGNDRKPCDVEEAPITGSSQRDLSGAVGGSSKGGWSVVGIKLFEAASRLYVAAEERNAESTAARSLADAFAAVPAEDVDAMLRKRFLERGVLMREGKVGVGGGGDAKSLSPCSGDNVIAHALADACRDIVLNGLVGSETDVAGGNEERMECN